MFRPDQVCAAAGLLALMLALALPGAAWAHASLVRAEPADGAVVAQAPQELRLTFNEPVSPLVMRLIGPAGAAATLSAATENTAVVVKLPLLARGTHVLSWRVVSADGHPVGGSLLFSVGEASARPDIETAGDPAVRSLIWTMKLAIYGAIFIGVGGALFRSFMADVTPPWLTRLLTATIAGGLAATPLSVGLQGLDALDLRLNSLAQPSVWLAGLQSSYGLTAVMLSAGLPAGLLSLWTPRIGARVLAALAMAAAGLALALSGHASNALPQVLTRPSVFVHTVCVAFWIGALLPLMAAVPVGDRTALLKFSRVVPYALAALVGSAAVLAWTQLDRPDALWTTGYGLVLSCKIAAVAALLALAAVNRYRLVPSIASGAASARPLVIVIRTELGLAAAILALAALWRFTPPPRSLAASLPIEIHLHDARAMAHVTLTPVRGRPPLFEMAVFDGELRPLAVKAVTLTLANPQAGIEPVRRAARETGTALWRVDGIHVPVAGSWVVRVDLLIDDFERLAIEQRNELPRMP